MQSNKILIPAIVGTSAMTLFSYLVSESKNRNFREPEILGQLIERLSKTRSRSNAQMMGWILHYAMGVLFVYVYSELWKGNKIKSSVTSGALLGAASGLAGIAIWKLTFEAHPSPPAKNLTRFFGHLLLAHIVFGVFSTLTYKRIAAEKKP